MGDNISFQPSVLNNERANELGAHSEAAHSASKYFFFTIRDFYLAIDTRPSLALN